MPPTLSYNFSPSEPDAIDPFQTLGLDCKLDHDPESIYTAWLHRTQIFTELLDSPWVIQDASQRIIMAELMMVFSQALYYLFHRYNEALEEWRGLGQPLPTDIQERMKRLSDSIVYALPAFIDSNHQSVCNNSVGSFGNPLCNMSQPTSSQNDSGNVLGLDHTSTGDQIDFHGQERFEDRIPFDFQPQELDIPFCCDESWLDTTNNVLNGEFGDLLLSKDQEQALLKLSGSKMGSDVSNISEILDGSAESRELKISPPPSKSEGSRHNRNEKHEISVNGRFSSVFDTVDVEPDKMDLVDEEDGDSGCADKNQAADLQTVPSNPKSRFCLSRFISKYGVLLGQYTGCESVPRHAVGGYFDKLGRFRRYAMLRGLHGRRLDHWHPQITHEQTDYLPQFSGKTNEQIRLLIYSQICAYHQSLMGGVRTRGLERRNVMPTVRNVIFQLNRKR